MDTFKKYMSDRLRNSLKQPASNPLKRTYAPPPPPRRATGGVKASPVYSVSRPATGAVRSAPVVLAPPPPTLDQRIGANINALAPPPANVIPFTAKPQGLALMADALQPRLASADTGIVSDTPMFQDAPEPEEDEPWVIWESPDGVDVVAPASYTGPSDWTQGQTITDPEAIANAQQSPLSYDNQPPEIQDLFTTERPIYNDGKSPLWIGDDITRQQEEQRNESLSNRFVAGEIKRRNTPVTIASDFARQEQEQQTEQQVGDLMAQRRRSVSMASDRARQEQEQQQEQQAAAVTTTQPRESPFIIIRLSDGQYQTLTRAEWDAMTVPGRSTEEDLAAIGATVYEPTMVSDDFALPSSTTAQNPLPEDGLLDKAGDLWDGATEWATQDVKPILVQYMKDLAANPIELLNPMEVGKKGLNAAFQLLGTAPIPEGAKDAFSDILQGVTENGVEYIDKAKRGEFGGFVKESVDFIDWALTTDIPFSEIPGIGDRIRDASVGEVLLTTLNKPQQYTLEQVIDGWYANQTGNDYTDGGSTAIIGDLAELFGNSVAPVTTLPEWLEENDVRAVHIYENGIDVDGDGWTDLFGDEAVLYAYREDAGAWDSFILDIVTDPYNLLIVTGAAGAAVKNAGSRAALSSSTFARNAGRAAELLGEGITRGSRGLEGAGSLGLEFAPDLIMRGARSAPGLGRIFDDSADQIRRTADEGFTSASGAATRAERVEAVRRGEGAGGRAVDIARNEEGEIVGVRLADDTVRPIGPDQGRELERQLDTSKLNPAREADAEKLVTLRKLQDSGVDASQVPPRYLQPIDEILAANPGRAADIQEAITTGIPVMRSHVLNMDAAFSSGRSFPDAAIDTSRFVHDEFRPLFGDMTMPDYAYSAKRQSPTHTLTEDVIHTEWDSAKNRSARAELYRNQGPNDSMRKTLPSNPSNAQIAQAERYLNLVEEHVRWNPSLIDDPSFQKVWEGAQKLRRQLADMGVSPRRPYTLRVSPSRVTPKGSNTLPNPDTIPAVTPDSTQSPDTPGDAPPEAPQSPQTSDVPEPDSVPVVPEEAAPSRTDRLVADGTLADEAAGDRLDVVADTYHWDDAHLDRATDLLAEARRATDAVPITAADLNTPAGRAYMTDVAHLLDKQDGIAALNEVVARGGNARLVKNAEADLARLRREVTALEKKLGFSEGPGRARMAKSKQVIPDEKSKAAKQYAKDTEKLRTVKHTSRSTFRRTNGNRTGFVADQGGMTYMATPYGDIVLTPEQMAELTKWTFENGDTTLDRWAKNINALAGDPRLTPDEIIERSRVQTRTELHERLDELYPTKQPGLIGKTWDKYTQYLRDSILGSWLSAVRYWSNTTMGNASNLLLGGYGLDAWKVFNARNINRYAQDIKRTADVTGADLLDVHPHAMPSDKISATLGMDNAPELRRQFRTDSIVTNGTAFERWANRHKLPGIAKRPVGALVTGDSAVLRQAQGMDMVMRDAVFNTATLRELKPSIREFREAAKERMLRAGFTEDTANAALKRFADQYPTGFAMADVQRFFKDAGLPPGIADRLGRDWQSAVNTIRNNARKEVSRVTFAGRETNLDTMTRRFVMFSYFMSRQYGFLIKQGLRHPGLINAYLSYQEFIDRYMDEHPDMPMWMRGMIRITGMPGGTSLAFNPTALWEIGNIFAPESYGGLGDPPEGFIWVYLPGEKEPVAWDKDDELPDGAYAMEESTWMEKIFLENPYIFMHPGITNTLNLGGFLGGNRDVDFTNTHNLGRYEAFGENLLRMAGLIDDPLLAGNRSDDLWNRMRDFVSSKTDWIPGAEQVDFIESADQENAELRALALDEAERMGMDKLLPDTTDLQAWVEEQMADPDSELYQRAMKRYLLDEGTGLVSKLVPGLAGLRPITRQMNNEGQDLMGNLTKDEKAFVRSPDPQGRALGRQMNEWYELGDENPAGQRADEIYQMIVYDGVEYGAELNGVYYSADEINAMSLEERKDFAMALMAEENVTPYWSDYNDAQDQFLAQPENAEYAQFSTWRTGVYGYTDGPEGYWEEVIKKNPNAARYYNSLDLENMTEDEKRKALTGTWAFFAVAGIQPNIYQPEPIGTNFYDPLDVANKAPQPVPYEPYVSEFEEDTRDQVAKYQREMSKADPVLRQIKQDMGIDPDTPLNNIYYRTRYDIMDEYEARTGKKVPYEKSDSYYRANLYFQWVDQQPDGADTSLDAYFEEGDKAYQEGLPADFNALQENEDVDPYDFYDKSRNKDEGFRYEDED